MTTPPTSPEDNQRAQTPTPAETQGGQSGQGGQDKLRNHLANERTLLAWARTGIAVMALGFVVARFGLLIRELSLREARAAPQGTANWFGIALIILGAALIGLSLLRYLRIARGIDEGKPRVSPELDIILSGGLIAAGLALALYLALTG